MNFGNYNLTLQTAVEEIAYGQMADSMVDPEEMFDLDDEDRWDDEIIEPERSLDQSTYGSSE